MKTAQTLEPSPTTRAIEVAHQAHLSEALRSENWERRGLLRRLTHNSGSR
jgi:hypothetical protein